MAQEEDAHSLEAKFVAAVKVIRSLPEEGPFQPSDDMLLMFYSYYKQATLGPCNISRPLGFWDTSGKDKWDAWSSLGKMTKEEAMRNYVEDIQLILETIPISDEVSDLVEKLGNFYTEVNRGEEEEDEDNEEDQRPFTRPFASPSGSVSDSTPGPKLLMVDKGWRSDTTGSCSSMEPSMSSFTNGTQSSLNSEVEEEELACCMEPSVQHNSYMHFNGQLSGHTDAFPEKTHHSTDSDNEEFCDSMEHLAMEKGLSTSRILTAGAGAASARQRELRFESNTTPKGGEDQVLMGDSYLKEGISASRHNSSWSGRGRGSQSPRATRSSHRAASVDAACCRVPQSRHSISSVQGNVNKQIAAALLRLQHDMATVLQRLRAVEALTVSQVTVPLSHLINVLHTMKSSLGSSSSASYKSRKHKEQASDSERHPTEPTWNLRELGLSDLGAQQLDELVNGFSCGAMPMSYSRQHPMLLQSVCTELQHWPDSLKRTRLILLVLLLVGLYGLSKTPFISGLDSAVDPVQVKNVTFEHVKGVDEAKNELQEVVEFLKNPDKFTALGGKLPKGVLLIGPPGTGKTLLARAVAGEADVPFYYASGSEFDEMFVGVGASRIRNLFKEAKANAPCVIFIDELDSVGGKRIESPMHPYSRQTINQLLAEMDGALIRPGRFDMQVTVPKPDVKGRTEILNWYLKKIKMDPDIQASIIARGTVGFSGADLENLVNQAALKAAVDGKDMVTLKELEFAKDKILMGPERRSVEIDKQNKLITAYHESGHAIVAHYTKDAMPINKATIMPRGPSLGHVSMLPEDDRWSETRAQLLAQMDVSMGGRVAEEIIFGHEYITTGASSDFDGATKIAKMMVTRFGMCQKLGVMTYTDMTAQSPETQAAVEHEVRVLLKDSYERAKVLLRSHTKEHKDLADALIMYETLDAKEIKLVLEGKALETR
ncbi:ATP-dependent zinc metalloprotease YME1L1 [Liparis tanakae]|uniref:ATP-dependent zinc metalloprotease YME1L1 n=1 Tax=Liparis tanakae TaxID=230148 RepID=A0A4Z2IUL2_9TELE|nr:ATP-dependent zinc metalloprotease YME1L1 [Liparis tanakae]